MTQLPLPLSIPRELLSAYSNASVTRREIAERMGEPIGFGRLLAELHQVGLPLPRFPSDRNSAGVRLIEELTERATARAG